MAAQKKPQPDGERMSYWITTVLEDERERAGITEDQMATALGVERRTISRLEEGKTMGRDIDRSVAGYAYVIGIEDPRDIWHRAMGKWTKEGRPPAFVTTEGPAAAFARAIRTEALRRKQSQPERTERRKASRRKGTGD